MLLFRGSDSSVYGATATAPGFGGALLEINSDSSLTSTKINGTCTPVVQASDGNFYGRGTTNTLCQMAPNGNVTTVSAVNQGLSAIYISPIVVNSSFIGNDGSLYGTV